MESVVKSKQSYKSVLTLPSRDALIPCFLIPVDTYPDTEMSNLLTINQSEPTRSMLFSSVCFRYLDNGRKKHHHVSKDICY